MYPKLHEQLDKLVEASKGVKELLGHSRHEDLLLAPVSPECVPRGQLVQSSAASVQAIVNESAVRSMALGTASSQLDELERQITELQRHPRQ